MNKIIAIVSVFMLVSCAEPATDDSASSVCDCYKLLHRVPVDEEATMNFIADSCNVLYKNAIQSVEGDAEAKAKFDAGYNACQNEK